MLKLFACASALLAIVMSGSVTAQEPARSVSIELQGTGGTTFTIQPIPRDRARSR
jgi:hypothetical protein